MAAIRSFHHCIRLLRRHAAATVCAAVLLLPLAGAAHGAAHGAADFPAGQRFRAVLFGLAAGCGSAEDRGAAAGEAGEERLALAVGTSLVEEGGFDPAALRQALRRSDIPRAAPTARQGSAVLAEYRRLLQSEHGSVSSLRHLLAVVPVTLAYARRPTEALRAAAAVATWNRPEDTELRGAARAYAALLLAGLQPEPASRKARLKEARRLCGSAAIEDALLLVPTHQPVDAASLQVAESLTHLLRAWYLSEDYEDALQRLAPCDGAVRRALVGALAGAEYGLAEIRRHRWPGAARCRAVEGLTRRLRDLAGDGVLLPVRSAEPLPGAAAATATAAAEEPQPPPPGRPARPRPSMPPLPAIGAGRRPPRPQPQPQPQPLPPAGGSATQETTDRSAADIPLLRTAAQR